MHFSGSSLSTLVPFLLPLLSQAAPWSSDSSSWGSSSSSPKTHLVVVGGEAGLTYTPPVTYAKKGELVFFEFRFKNHTVTQSAFDTPCTPLEGGFDSGFNPVGVNETNNFPGFVVTVEDESKPMWFHCEQLGLPAGPPHCFAGMVGVVNPPAKGNTFDKFLKKAKALLPPPSESSAAAGSSATASVSAWAPPSSSSSASEPTWTTLPPDYKPPNEKIHLVKVGGAAGLVYDPPVTKAQKDDQVIFQFMFKNHTVTQSAFDTPCTALEGGFDSGFQPVSMTETANFPAFIVTVTDASKPLWYHCQQLALPGGPPHCPSGMVGVVNPPEQGNTFDKFLEKAKALLHASGSSGSWNSAASSAWESATGWASAAPTGW